jgi:hypothetical protein
MGWWLVKQDVSILPYINGLLSVVVCTVFGAQIIAKILARFLPFNPSSHFFMRISLEYHIYCTI